MLEFRETNPRVKGGEGVRKYLMGTELQVGKLKLFGGGWGGRLHINDIVTLMQ